MTRDEWREEVLYCMHLVLDGGNRNVPVPSVTSYLQMQKGAAQRKGHQDIALELQVCLTAWLRR